jgi:hypothetical protein
MRVYLLCVFEYGGVMSPPVVAEESPSEQRCRANPLPPDMTDHSFRHYGHSYHFTSLTCVINQNSKRVHGKTKRVSLIGEANDEKKVAMNWSSIIMQPVVLSWMR